jgi:hypothetical protein
MLEKIHLDVFHAIIYAFEQSLLTVAGRGGAKNFIPPAINAILHLDKKGLIELPSGDLKTSMKKFSEDMKTIAQHMTFQKNNDEFVLNLVGCKYAASHTALGHAYTPFVCPVAIIAAAVIKKATNQNVRIVDSHVTKGGSITKIVFD